MDLEYKSRYTGKERDAETGLDYFDNRYVSSSLGRFISPDRPFADQNVFDPQSWNQYAFVRNNPLRFVDRDGSQAQGFELMEWIAAHEPELAISVRALMAAKDIHSFAQAIKEAVWGGGSPSDKIQRALESVTLELRWKGYMPNFLHREASGVTS